MPLAAGARLGSHEIMGLIGRGGMGEVYRARDTLLDRTVAIKVLDETGAPEEESRRRLLREARAASALNHPNIVTIHAVEQHGDQSFIVMEHVSGAPLRVPPGGLPIDTALDYAEQIAGALAAAHEAAIVHRDIKPANVMIGPTGHVKVLDFGIARRSVLGDDPAARQLTTEGTLTATGVLLGTVGYLAPEQIAGGPADRRSDVFAFGVLLYEMLAGTAPFARSSVWSTLDATVHAAPQALGEIRRDVPPELAAIASRALAKRPDDRYTSARELLADLAAVRAARSGTTRARPSRASRAILAGAVALAVGGVAMFAWSRSREAKLRWARETAAPEIQRLLSAGELVPAYRLAQRAVAAAPGDTQITDLWHEVARATPITSTPAGAEVAFRAYSGADEGWIPLGTTPSRGRRPLGLLRWRVTKDGYDPLEAAPNSAAVDFHLVARGQTPPGMAFVPASTFELESNGTEVQLPEYWVDKYEVTNREFMTFVEKGGYRDPRYWQHPFVKDGRTLTFAEAMDAFRDSTGRPGPATWELGSYPEGQDDYPVSGVSWHEAAAYAVFAGKRLPTVFHWYNASGAFGPFSEILRFSNFGGKGPVRVGTAGALGPYGTYDMAGNVKEWCWNETSNGRRYILGGGWNEVAYQFRDMDAQPSFDRRAGFGFRCMRDIKPMDPTLLHPVSSVERDPSSFKAVGNELYEAYRRLYDYDPIPLDARVEEVDEGHAAWRRERVSFRAAYGNERVPAYVFLPRNASPPFQAVVFFPGSDAVRLQSSRELSLQWLEFVIRAGRAVIYPVYQQTYERRNPNGGGQNFLREISVQRGLDVRRTVDYLQSRKDLDSKRIALFGISLGAQLAPVYLAIEPRLRTGVLLSGGFETWTMPPETDPVNFAPRVRQPVLMVNGREDFDLPYQTAQVPLFRMLGTPDANKTHAVLEGGHIPPKPREIYKEILDWLDRYLGPVAPPRS